MCKCHRIARPRCFLKTLSRTSLCWPVLPHIDRARVSPPRPLPLLTTPLPRRWQLYKWRKSITRPPSTYRHLEQADIELAVPNSLSTLLPSCFLPPTSFPPQARSAVSPLYTTEGKISISLSLYIYIYISLFCYRSTTVCWAPCHEIVDEYAIEGTSWRWKRERWWYGVWDGDALGLSRFEIHDGGDLYSCYNSLYGNKCVELQWCACPFSKATRGLTHIMRRA
jgi:hypothetical protein